MGCGASKDEDPDMIKNEMKTTKIDSFDEVY